MESLNGISVFVQAAQTQSFVAAGRALGISASAVSKSISRLEDRVGVRLFQRSTRSVRLTTEGEVFLERCQRILGEIDAAEQEISALTKQVAGRLRVGLPYAAGLPLPVVASFMEQYPEVELDLDFSDRLTDVIDDGMDVVIRGGELSDSRLMSKRLGSFRVCLVAAPAYLQQCGTPMTPSELVHHACLHYRYPSSGKLEPWPLKNAAPGIEEAVPMTMISNSLDALLQLTRQGRGITCVPDFSVKQDLVQGNLELVLDSYMTRSFSFQILWPSSKQLSPKVRAFVDFFSREFGRQLVSKTKASRLPRSNAKV